MLPVPFKPALPPAAIECRSCGVRLHHQDNYCRKCGAAVDVFETQLVEPAPPGPVATLRAAAVPAVTSGASMVVAGALVRFAFKQLFKRSASRHLLSAGERSLGAGEIEEIFY